jgi:cyclase
MHRWFYVAAMVWVLSGAGLAWGQPDTSEVEIKTIHVKGSVHMLVGSGGNLGVSAGPDGLLLIDDQFAPLSEKIQAALEGLSENPLRFVLNTHWHHDHTGGNETFGKKAPIVAHANVRKRLAEGGSFRLLDMTLEPVNEAALPVVTYEQKMTFYLNGEQIDLFHMPQAHTDGDSVVIFNGSGVAHLGDLMFSGSFPFVDRDSGGSVEGLLRHVKSLLQQLPKDIKIIPGHGPLSGYEDLERYREMLVATTEIIRGHLSAGKTEEETVAEGLPEHWKTWGNGFISEENWIRTVYRAYSK